MTYDRVNDRPHHAADEGGFVRPLVGLFHDRRPSADPEEADYQTMMDRNGARNANARLRLATPDYSLGSMNNRILAETKQRSRSRQAGTDSPESVGDYLARMTS